MRLQFTEFAQLVGRKPGGRVIGDRSETHGPEAGKLNQVGPISDRLWFNEMKVPGKGDTGNPQSRHVLPADEPVSVGSVAGHQFDVVGESFEFGPNVNATDRTEMSK